MSVVLQVSDTHFGTEQPRVVEALLRLVHAQRPTLVVLSGDITQRARWQPVPGRQGLHRALGGARTRWCCPATTTFRSSTLGHGSWPRMRTINGPLARS